MPRFVALILFVAVSLKILPVILGQQSLESTATPSGMFLIPELVLATFLWTRRFPEVVRYCGLLAFAIFLLVNLRSLALGRPSCGCFGQIAVHPAIAAAINIVALVALSRWKTHAEATTSGPYRKFGVLLIGMSTFAIVAWQALGLVARNQRVAFDKPSHDFGTVPSLTVNAHTFTIANGSSEAAEIVKVRTNCNCSATEDLAGRLLAPGQSMELPVTLRVSVDDEQQYADVIVYYTFGGGLPRTASARVTATPRPHYRVHPRASYLDLDAAGDGGAVIELEPVLDPDAKIIAATTTDEHLVVRLDEAGRKATVTLKQNSAAPSPAINGWVNFKTNSTAQPTFSVVAKGTMKSLASVEPIAIVIPSSTVGVVGKTLTVTLNGPSVELRGITCNDPGVEIVAQTGAKAGQQSYLLRVPEKNATVATAEVSLSLSGRRNGVELREIVRVPIYRLSKP